MKSSRRPVVPVKLYFDPGESIYLGMSYSPSAELSAFIIIPANQELFQSDRELGETIRRSLADAAEQFRSWLAAERQEITSISPEERKSREAEDAARRDRWQKTLDAPGFVYLMFDSESNEHKIGFSTNPENRLLDLRRADRLSLQLLSYWPGTRRIEQELHKRFLDNKLHGEWFSLDEAAINGIEAYFQSREI